MKMLLSEYSQILMTDMGDLSAFISCRSAITWIRPLVKDIFAFLSEVPELRRGFQCAALLAVMTCAISDSEFSSKNHFCWLVAKLVAATAAKQVIIMQKFIIEMKCT